ncbi:MAG: hypothetical protein O2794_02620 [bacterium]|nr:hypothetical protein [bacterium]
MTRWYDIRGNNGRRSFTLLESIVAIYVLLLGIVGAITLAERNITAVLILKDQLIAANLAQEGLELIRNKRDSNFLLRASGGCTLFFPPCNANDANLDGMVTNVMGGATDICNAPGTCGIENPISMGQITFDSCPNLNGCVIYLGANGVYDHDSSGTQTKFTRTITVVPYDPPRLDMGNLTPPGTPNPIRDATAHVTVSWKDRFSTHDLVLRTVLVPIFQVGL